MAASAASGENKEQTITGTGGEILLRTLLASGADTAFGVPGESFLGALDAMYDLQDRFRFVICRHEANATNMAEAAGKLTGAPGIAFVTRGPGASHASIAVHTAFQDSTPLILFVGHVNSGFLDREAFQEIDYRQMFGKTAKWVVQIDDGARIPELVGRAFHVAVNGRSGPVVVVLPEDVFTDTWTAPAPTAYRRAGAAPTATALDEMDGMLASAERPILVLGGGGWSAEACADIQVFAEAHHLPVAVGFRRQDLFDNRHPQYIGDMGLGIDKSLVAQVREADLLLVVGERLGEATTKHYAIIDIPNPTQRLIHVHPDANELGIVYRSDLLINATMGDFARAARARPAAAPSPGRRAWVERGRQAYEDKIAPRQNALRIDMAKVVTHLSDTLPDDAIITNGAGTYSGFVHRYFQFPRYGTQLAPTSGAMGYGLPAAIAAKLLHPERAVVCFAGDGCFLMASQELATASQYGIAVIVIVLNNSSYGSIRMHQEREYPGRTFGTGVVSPDFTALAAAYGAYAETVETTEAFPGAFERAQASGRPALLEIEIDIDTIIANNPRK